MKTQCKQVHSWRDQAVSGSCVYWPGVEAAIRKPVGVAQSCEKHIAFGEPHHLPDAVLPTGDEDVFVGVRGDATQGKRRKGSYGEVTVNGFILGTNETAGIIHFSQAGWLTRNAGSEARRARFDILAIALAHGFLNGINLINFTGSQIPHLKNGMVDLGECSCLILVWNNNSVFFLSGRKSYANENLVLGYLDQ